MKLLELNTEDGPVAINPNHIVAIEPSETEGFTEITMTDMTTTISVRQSYESIKQQLHTL